MENTENCFRARRLTTEYFALLKTRGYGAGLLVVEGLALQDLAPAAELLGHIGECLRCSKYYEGGLGKITGLDLEPEQVKKHGKMKTKPKDQPIKNLAIEDGSLILSSDKVTKPKTVENSLSRQLIAPAILTTIFMFLSVIAFSRQRMEFNIIGWITLCLGLLFGFTCLHRFRRIP